ncbi:energy transducer TonB [Enhydrobacter sp.]|uniref:energy transducer TonB family protein n=1 Tax=Enhydrobacter sp. TaxID=1894999 RepID=UPI0026252653|nr:energy transducer TonB [Enhydrobacter sp.]
MADVSASLPTFRTGRMPPAALMLAVLLHGLVALGLWGLSLREPRLTLPRAPIDVTFEQPKAKPPPPPPTVTPKARPAPPDMPGLAPPAEITADKPSQVPSRAREARQALAPERPLLEQAVPPPQAEVTAPPTFEPLQAARPAPSRQAHISSVPAPAQPARPAQEPQFRPSPLTQAPRRQPPAIASREAPTPSPFVNPADTYNRARVADNYLWQVVRKLAGYHYEAQASVQEGTTVLRIVIARDGRLLDVAVARSSGFAALDRGVVAGVRAGAPYAPLPPDIHGDSATFTLPLVSIRRQ